MERANQVVQTVLEADRANVADNRLSRREQSGIRLYDLQPIETRTVSHDRDSRLRDAVALDVDLFVRLVGGDDVICQPAGEFLQGEQYSVDQRIAIAIESLAVRP